MITKYDILEDDYSEESGPEAGGKFPPDQEQIHLDIMRIQKYNHIQRERERDYSETCYSYKN